MEKTLTQVRPCRSCGQPQLFFHPRVSQSPHCCHSCARSLWLRARGKEEQYALVHDEDCLLVRDEESDLALLMANRFAAMESD